MPKDPLEKQRPCVQEHVDGGRYSNRPAPPSRKERIAEVDTAVGRVRTPAFQGTQSSNPSQSNLKGRTYSPMLNTRSISTAQQFKPGTISEEVEEYEQQAEDEKKIATMKDVDSVSGGLCSTQTRAQVSVSQHSSSSAESSRTQAQSIPHERIVMSRIKAIICAMNAHTGNQEGPLRVPRSIRELKSNAVLFRKIVSFAMDNTNATRAQKNQINRMGFAELSNTLAKLEIVKLSVPEKVSRLRAGTKQERGASRRKTKKRHVVLTKQPKKRHRNVARKAQKEAKMVIGDSSSTSWENENSAAHPIIKGTINDGAWNKNEQGWLNRVFYPEESDFNKDSVIVAVRVRPLQCADIDRDNETSDETQPSVIVKDNTIRIVHKDAAARSKRQFTFDYCYDSSGNRDNPQYGSVSFAMLQHHSLDSSHFH